MSDIWERKVRTHFRRKDLDKDGVITRKDFLGMAARFADLEKFTPSQKETSIKCFDKLFSRYVKAAGENSDVLTEDLLVESLRSQKDDPGFHQCLRDLLLSLLYPLDLNSDGYLDRDEYRKFFENVGIVESEFTEKAFDALDVNKDGKLSYEEMLEAFQRYMCSDDENTVAVFGLLD